VTPPAEAATLQYNVIVGQNMAEIFFPYNLLQIVKVMVSVTQTLKFNSRSDLISAFIQH
jgi:hypothetical protein